MLREIKIGLATRVESGFRATAAEVSALAAVQHGVVARWQLLDLGINRGAIGRAISDGLLHLIHEGVYAVGHPAVTREGELLAGVLAGGRDARLGHASA